MRTKLQPGEEVALIVKRHWFVLIKPVLGKYNLVGFGLLIKDSFWYVLLGTGVYLLIALLNRKYDIWVLTNRRLIDEWGIITHNSKENSLDKINDIEIKQSIGTLIDKKMKEGYRGKIIKNTRVGSIRQGKEIVDKIKTGNECGMTFLPYVDFKVDDDIIAYKNSK